MTNYLEIRDTASPPETTAQEERKRKLENEIRLYRFGAVVVVLVTIAIVIGGAWQFTPQELEDYGQFLSGTASSCLSLAAILLIYIAFLGQRLQIEQQQEELEITREELRLTRQEVHGQHEQLELQTQTFQHQQFDETFFHLIQLHNEIVAGTEIEITTTTVSRGRQVFLVLGDYFKEELRASAASLELTGTPEVDHLNLIQRAYHVFYIKFDWVLGHYFRNFYHLVKFVDESPISNKRRYLHFLRAQLSTAELYLLFYHGLTQHGRRTLKPLIERYALLEHLPLHYLESPNEHRLLFDTAAYRDTPAKSD